MLSSPLATIINVAPPLPLTCSILITFGIHHYLLIVVGLVSALGLHLLWEKLLSHGLKLLI